MSGVAEAFFRGSRIEEKAGASLVEIANPSLSPVIPSVYDDQVRLLIEQLFLHAEHAPRHVGFTAADTQTEIAPLCLSIARTLSEQGKHDVGAIDASSHSWPLKFHIGNPEVRGTDTSEVVSNLWILQRQEWINGDSAQAISDENLARLGDLTRQFDFSILYCGPVSWLAARVGRTCDGLVLVLTANQTRRLVAQNIRDHLHAAQVPLLGTVLAERRFPIPTPLYRKL